MSKSAVESSKNSGSKVKKGKFRPDYASTVYLQVVGSGAVGAPRSLYVFTEHCRYFFNCGEGTQRLSSEHKVKLSMMEHVLVTHKSWENVGGLPGALLTLQDSGVTKITIHGPPGVESLYNDTKHFMRFSSLKIDYCHYENNDGYFRDGPLYIQAVPIWPKDSSESFCPVETSEKNGGSNNELEDMFAYENHQTCGNLSTVTHNQAESKEKLEESIKNKDVSIAYICRPSPKPGALLPLRCREFGVPPGPLMGKLKKGEDVTLPCGKLVKAVDVTDPPDQGPVFIVIEAPSMSYIDAIVGSPSFLKYQEATAEDPNDIADVVVHFTPEEVAKDSRYIEWINRFSAETTHIYINENSRCMGSESVHKIQYKLNHLYPESFPLLQDHKIAVIGDPVQEEEGERGAKRLKKNVKENGHDSSDSSSIVEIPEVGTAVKGKHFQSYTRFTYHIRPHLRIDESKKVKINTQEFIRECYDIEDFKITFDQVQEKIKEIRNGFDQSIPNTEYPHILFLGTGSCIPNKMRNTSAIVLNINPNSSVLLDCGEGTYGQMVRSLGVPGSEALLKSLSVIYISHLHADHHIGLIRVLLARKKVFKKSFGCQFEVPKVVLLAPRGIIHYLASYSANFEFITDLFTLIPNHCFVNERDDINKDKDHFLESCSSLGIRSVNTCFVHHCPSAYGVVITLEDDWKLAYSGDTMPCLAFVSIGMNCDVLVHEATMEDELKEDAKKKRHSTTSEAIDIGIQMKAKHVLLTHFSQRYAKVPLLDDVPSNVGVAFDNMLVHLSDLPCLSHLYPAYISIFSEDVDEMLKKRMKIKARNDSNL